MVGRIRGGEHENARTRERVCVRACVRACVHACMHACVRACVHLPSPVWMPGSIAWDLHSGDK